jgi:hypothetical protein
MNKTDFAHIAKLATIYWFYRSSPLYSRGNTRRVDGERIIENHLELLAGIKKHNLASTMVNKYQGNRDPGSGGRNP